MPLNLLGLEEELEEAAKRTKCSLSRKITKKFVRDTPAIEKSTSVTPVSNLQPFSFWAKAVED